MNNQKIPLVLVFILFALIILSNEALSEELTIRDVSIKIIIESIEPQTEYTRIFKVENLNHVQGTTDLLHFFLIASIKENNETINEWNLTRTINKYTETGMGSINLTSGKYDLCVTINPINYVDYNTSNNEDCKIITTTDFNFNSENNSGIENNSINNNVSNNTSNTNTSNDGGNNNYDCDCDIYCNACIDCNCGEGCECGADCNCNDVCECREGCECGADCNCNDVCNCDDDGDVGGDENDNGNHDGNDDGQNNDENNDENITNDLCMCEMQIITEKNLYDEGESIQFLIKDCKNTSTFEKEVEYWVEDIFGAITKTILKTSSKAAKTYTPKINQNEKTFLIKTKFIECNQTFSKVITVRGSELNNEKNTTIKLTTKEKTKPGEIIIIDITGYKAQSQKTLIDIQLELNGIKKSETYKVYIQNKNSDFQIKIPFKIPDNLDEGEKEYELVARGLDVDTKTIILIDVPKKEIIENIKINNFYTLKKKFDGELNAIINWQGSENATIRIVSQKETKEIITTEKSITVPIKINKPDETLIAELITNNKTHDIKLLKINLSGVGVEELIKENDLNKNNGTTVSSGLENDGGINTDVKNNNDVKANNNFLTDGLIYETNQLKTNLDNSSIVNETFNQTKQKKSLNEITANATSFILNNKKQTIFFVIAMASLIILFRAEIKTQFIKLKNLKKVKKLMIKIFN